MNQIRVDNLGVNWSYVLKKAMTTYVLLLEVIFAIYDLR